jgi:formiminotetrahydrofolate cyclodeaminase
MSDTPDPTLETPSRRCADFSAALASAAPVPGGGCAAALIGALGASLGEMAGGLTAGKKKYAVYAEDLRRMIRAAEELRGRFLSLMDADAEAFAPLARAYSLPKDAPHYAETMVRVTLDACRVPYAVMEACCEAVLLLEELRGKCGAMLLSDVGCGASAIRAALESAYLNVLVNTRSLPENEEALRTEQEAARMLEEYLPRAEKLSRAVVETLRRKDHG